MVEEELSWDIAAGDYIEVEGYRSRGLGRAVLEGELSGGL